MKHDPSAIASKTSAPIRKDNVTRGIYCMIAASTMFAASSALSKWQAAIYPVGEVMFVRSLSAMMLCAVLILPFTGLAVFRTRKPGAHIARGLSQSISQTFTVIAITLMPLAGATAISFSASLWAALFSLLWLKEKIGMARGCALLAGFIGVLIVVNPRADSLQIGALFALANAVMYGSVTVAVRGMTATESAKTLLMWQMITVTFFHSFLLLLGFQMPAPADAGMLVLSGFSNAAAQYFWTQALHFAPAAAVSPFYYLTLVWVLAIGFLVWGDVPTAWLLVGATIVVASSLFLLVYESRRKAALALLAAQAREPGTASTKPATTA